MTKPELNDTDLDALFGAARRSVPEPDDAFLTALAEQAAVAMQPRKVQRPSVLQQLRSALGGWGGLSGLVATTVTGFWIGVAPPASVSDIASLVTGFETETTLYVDLLNADWQALEDG